MDPDERCRRLCQEQLGLLHVEQALAAGLTRAGLRHRIQKGVFVRGLTGILRMVGAPRTYEQRQLEALMWAGEDAALSHRCAAFEWKLDPIDAKIIELISPRDLRHAPDGILVHRGTVPPRDLGLLRNLRVTSPARTIVDLASVVDEESLEIALDCALCRRLTSVSAITRCLQAAGKQGRNGSATLSRLLALRDSEAPLGMSPLEVRFLRLLRERRVGQPRSQHEVIVDGRRFVLDYAYPNENVGIEIDGYRWHSSPDRLTRDRRRSNALVLAGWRLLHFTDPDLRYSRDRVVASVLAARGNAKLWDSASL